MNMTAAKAWLSLLGGLLTVVIPLLVQVSGSLPEPWPAVIGAVVAVLTALGVYRVPNKLPANTVLVPADPPTYTPVEPPGGYPNPYE